ncbi:unnamed protein product, partial [Lampetra planeri]
MAPARGASDAELGALRARSIPETRRAEAVQDVYWLAQCLCLTGQHHRASHTIRSRKLDKFTSKEYQLALDVLEKEEPLSERLLQPPAPADSETHIPLGIPPHAIESSIALLRGCVLEAMENRALAAESYRDALRPRRLLLRGLPHAHHSRTCSPHARGSRHDAQLLRFLYQNKLKK